MTVVDFLLARNEALAPHADHAPTALLAFLAGAHAPLLARVWPAPHAEFLALPAARRHLAAIALTHAHPAEYARLRRVTEAAPLRDLTAFAAPVTPRGLARAVARLGETLWPAAEYAALLALLREPEAALVLRHAEWIDRTLLAKLDALPPVLRKARIVAHLPHVEAAAALADGFAAARLINPRRPERDLVLAFERAKDKRRLFEAAVAAIRADRFGQIGPPPAMTRPYRAITARTALDAEALRFRNCIASYVWEIGAEQMAVYVCEREPAAMIALKRDVGGWRMAEALGVENAALPEDLLRVIAADFAAAGVRIGPPMRMIEERLEAIGEAEAPVVYPQTYAARIGLGQLWR